MPQDSKLDHLELDALSQESARQELEDYLESLKEREKGLRVLEEAQQFLEDQLEDANTEIDRLRRDLDKASVEAEEAMFMYKESERARKELEQTVYQFQEGKTDTTITDLRDMRMQKHSGVVSLDSVTRGPFIRGILLGILLAALITVGGLEILSFIQGKGELFALLLNGGS